jgi:hypothetical protein
MSGGSQRWQSASFGTVLPCETGHHSVYGSQNVSRCHADDAACWMDSSLQRTISLRIFLVLFLRHRHSSSTRNKCSNAEDNSQHAAHHEELEQRTASSRVIQIIQRPLDPPSGLMPRAVQLLMPHLMSILVEMRHVVVHTLRETTRPSARSRWVVVCPLWSTRSVLRALLALLAPAS